MPISKGKMKDFLEVCTLIQGIYRLLIDLLNRKSFSQLIASFSKSKISRILIPIYSKVYQLDLEEMEKPLKEYKTIHDLFTRKLQNGARLIDENPLSVVSPVDAILQEYGIIDDHHCVKVKEKEYSITEMLGGTEKVQKYRDGTYMIFYLSPSHYHRIHSPVSGRISKQWIIGSKSYPVNHYGLKYGKRPLAKNYRMITELEFNEGSVAVVKVGAMYINSIVKLSTESHLRKGAEMAYFSFGSSVVLLFQAGTFMKEESLITPRQIKVGECIGYLNINSNQLVK
jgi:phosphatidylserine decarboxylase